MLELLALEGKLDMVRVVDAIIETEENVGKAKTITTSGKVEEALVRKKEREEKKRPLTIKPPAEMRGDQVTAAWKLFCWICRSQLNSKKFTSFDVQNVAIEIMVKEKTAYGAIQSMITDLWLHRAGTRHVPNKTGKGGANINLYTVSEAAREWLQDGKNQRWLIERGIIEAPPEPEQVL